MKKYKVIEESLCNHLMAIARGEPPSQIESIPDVKPNVSEPIPEPENKESMSKVEPEVTQAEPEAVEEKTSEEMTGGGAAKESTQPCDCVMHQTGLGIKRTVPEDWLSFDKFVEKKKQQPKIQPRRKEVAKKKKKVQKKGKKKCTKRRRR